MTDRTFAQRDLLHFSIWKSKPESRLLIDCGRDCSDVRIIAKHAEEVRVLVFADVMAYPHPDTGGDLLRVPLVFKQPHPQVCILHRRLPPSEHSRSASRLFR